MINDYLIYNFYILDIGLLIMAVSLHLGSSIGSSFGELIERFVDGLRIKSDAQKSAKELQRC